MKKFLAGFSNAMKGILTAVAGQMNLKVQLIIALLVVAAGFYFEITALEWCVLLLIIGVVLALEMMNTAIEHLVDLVTTEWKPLAGKVKDIAAGSVLVAACASIVIGWLIFGKYFMER